MRNILGIAGGVGLVVLVAATQIRIAQPNPGGLVPGNAFAQEPRRSASDDEQGPQDVGAPLQQLQADAAPGPEARRDWRVTQTPARYTRVPTLTM